MIAVPASSPITQPASPAQGRPNTLLIDPLIAQLIARRVELGLSRADLGRRLGVGGNAIYNLESGRTSPLLYTLRRWAQALDWVVYVAPALHVRGRRGR